MKEREANQKYRREFFSAMMAYLLVLFASITFAKDMEPGLVRTLLLITPTVPLMLTIWAIARHMRRLDEFMRLRSLEGLAVAAAVTAALSFSYGFLESAGFPKQSMFWVWGVMGFVWGAHACLRCLFKR
jgi:hypothetical protein